MRGGEHCFDVLVAVPTNRYTKREKAELGNPLSFVHSSGHDSQCCEVGSFIFHCPFAIAIIVYGTFGCRENNENCGLQFFSLSHRILGFRLLNALTSQRIPSLKFFLAVRIPPSIFLFESLNFRISPFEREKKMAKKGKVE